MSYRIIFYSPDTHIQYDGRLPYQKGVGGGITARIRMSRALARAGHKVTMVVNCGGRTNVDGVHYIPLDQAVEFTCDVLIMNTSGGALDLSPVLNYYVDAGLKLVWTSGTPRPGGLDKVGYDFVYAKSNFLRDVAIKEWEVPEKKIFVAYNGFEEGDFQRAQKHSKKRDPHRLVYFSHPSKGLETAVDITQRLRDIEPRFHLEVFGGNQLWGQEEAPLPGGEGVEYHGLVNQNELLKELMKCSYSINLQARLEPFGMVITESMRAGNVVLASPVGAFEELIRHGEDGFLIPEDHNSVEAREHAATIIFKLANNPDAFRYVQRNARRVIWDSDTMVKVWEGHWGWWFAEEGFSDGLRDSCPLCGGDRLWLADGYHCVGCGTYARGR